MQKLQPPPSGGPKQPIWPWLFVAACLLPVVIAILLPGEKDRSPAASPASSNAQSSTASTPSVTMDRDAILPRKLSSAPAPVASPAEIVASKLSQFARQRRDLAEAIARRRNVQVPDDVQRFFAAVEGGRWEEIDAAFKVLSDRKKADP